MNPPPAAERRLAALDWMRGLVMVLMTLDHASGAFNAGRLSTDGVSRWVAGTALPADQFLTRWVTHLCAPTFVFLAGSALALSLHRRLAQGAQVRAQEGFMLRRGLFIALMDPLWMSWAFLSWGRYLLQVLYVLGVGMMCMVPLRRLGARALTGLGLGLIVGNEALSSLWGSGPPPPVPVALLFGVGSYSRGQFIVNYPLVPWLGVMCLGWAFGCRLVASRAGVSRLLAGAGVASLALFLGVRGLDGYGNARFYREGAGVLQWLHVSKYPPSLAYAALELGLMALLLAGFWWIQERWGEVQVLEPLKLLGQTALFFYLLHVHLLYGVATWLGVRKQLGLGTAYMAAVLALGVLSVLCARFRRYKAAHPHGWTRYV